MHVTLSKTLLFQLILCFLLINFYGLSSQQDPSTICPPAEVIEPCTCTKSCPVCDALVKCSNILNNDDLVRIFNKSSDYVFWNFYIENSTFLYIPSDTLVLKRTRFLYLKNNVMVSLFDKPPPPTNVLKELELRI
ncbi:uncharacterized protein CEXT_347311 [Caerostris extrusa]|uniref:Uncharacterized protein n=1 Tax=Caerostris extrusa TaxID=172846 RepID=A0AAV4U1E7_CAEEX|nr:uncharacterized protein CEXT_347311 [Caerostris extrusa]